MASNPVFFEDEAQARRVMKQEGLKLKNIAIREWQSYLNMYKPVEYIRTGDSERAIKLGMVKVLDPYHIGIELTWVNNLVYHDSWLYNKGKVSRNERGHSVMLMSKGWHSKKLEKAYKKKVYRHTYYEGNGYIDNVVKQYEQTKDPRITLEVQWSGAFTK